MDEKEEQELIEKGLRYRPMITDAKTYVIDPLTGKEIESKEVKEDVTAETICDSVIRQGGGHGRWRSS